MKSYAERPTDVSLSDRRADHVTSCNYCLGRLLQFLATRPPRASLSFRWCGGDGTGMFAGRVCCCQCMGPETSGSCAGSVGRASSYFGPFAVWNLPRGPASEQPSTPSSRRARKPGTCPSSSKPTWCLLHHGCSRTEAAQSCGMRNSNFGRVRSTDGGHRVSRPPKRSTRQLHLATQLRGEDAPYTHPLQIE